MLKRVFIYLSEAVLMVLLSVTFASCEPKCKKSNDDENRKVVLLYSAGYNSLSTYLREDQEDLLKGYIPGDRCYDDVLLVYSHLTTKSGNYSVPATPTLTRISKSDKGVLQKDTLVVYPETTVSSSAKQLNTVLSYVKDNFRGRSYGMIFSSHATGYLPSGYYSNPADYEASAWLPIKYNTPFGTLRAVPYKELDFDPSLPLTKSIGQDVQKTAEGRIAYEIDLADFVEAIPMRLDYILFDACLMGGVEVAYQMRDVCGKVGFSQAEVLAEGFDYQKIMQRLLVPEEPMLEKVCEDYYLQYDAKKGAYRSATISLVDCSKMDALEKLCASLFEKYSAGLDAIDPSKVQRYYRSSYHWFYDLESILLNAGINEQEQEALHAALDECMLYKAATPSFMGDFDIEVFSGFSMFLPCDGGDRLKEFYKGLDWNKTTGLVK